MLDMLISDTFFLSFQSLVEREMFSRKRHECKVTYIDAQITRDILIGTNGEKGLFESIFAL